METQEPIGRTGVGGRGGVQGQDYSETTNPAAPSTMQQQQQAFRSSAVSSCLTADFDPNLNSTTSSNSSNNNFGNVILVSPQPSSSQAASPQDVLSDLDEQTSYILSPSDHRYLNAFVRPGGNSSQQAPPSYEEHQVVAADLNQLSISPNGYQLVHHHNASTNFVHSQNDPIVFRSDRYYQNVSLLEPTHDNDSVELVSEMQVMLNNYAAGQVNFGDIDPKQEIVEFNLEPMSVVFKEEDRCGDYEIVGRLGSGNQDETVIADLGKFSPVDQFKSESLGLDAIGSVLDREQERILLENTMSPLLAAVNNVTQAAELMKMEQHSTASNSPTSMGRKQVLHQTSLVAGSSDGLSSLDLFGQIVEVMPTSIPTVVENINNNRNLDLIEGSSRELIISNSYVPCRAYASLPTNYLHFRRETDTNEMSPYASKIIPINTKFGPFEGIIRSVSPIEMQSIANDMICNRRISLLILNKTQILDVTDEKMSNWMRYVRITRSLNEQNLALIETSGQLFFRSCKTIKPKERLLFNFSDDYKSRYLNALLCKGSAIMMSPSAKAGSEALGENEDDSDTELKQLMEMQGCCEEKLSDKENIVYNCRLCQKVFANEERWAKHNLIHSEEESRGGPCTRCRKVFTVQSSLEEHMKLHDEASEKLTAKLLTCPLCDLKLRRQLFADHVRSHCVNGSYTCPHCSKKFKKYYLIRKHIRDFHPEIQHPCDQCEKSFKTSTKLKLHLIRHSDKREFLCSECGKMLKRKDKLNEHIRRFHSAERSSSIEEAAVEPAREKKPRLKRTKKIDNDDDATLAELKVAAEAKKRKALIKSPSNEEYERFVYKCHDCRLGFKRRGMLVNHLHKRHPEIPIDSVPELNLPIMKEQKCYYCQFCDKVYKSSSKRKAHIMKYHPNSIDVNEIRTYRNPAFSETVGSITTEPQACPWCYKQYASKTKLIQHQRIKHPEQMKESNWSNSSTESTASSLGRPTLLRQNAVIETGVQEVRQPSFENFEVTDKNFYDIEYQLKKNGGSFDSHEVPQQQTHPHLEDTDLTELTITQTDLLELESSTNPAKIGALFDDVDLMQLKAVELQCFKDTTEYFAAAGIATTSAIDCLTTTSTITTALDAPGSSKVRIEFHGAG